MTKKTMQTMGWLAMTALVAVVMAAPAMAQQGKVRVHIPFAFAAGTDTLPAGEYVMERSSLTGTGLLKLHDVDRNDAMAIMSLPAGHGDSNLGPRLVFEILAGQYRLSEVWLGNGEYGSKLPRTKEQALIAKQEGKVKTVLLALKQDRN